MKNSDIGKSFEKLVRSAFINIDGVLIEREGAGFKYNGKHFVTRAALKEEIWRMRQELNKSINRLKK
jgi:hypothetical protein